MEMMVCKTGVSGRVLRDGLGLSPVSRSKTDLIINWGCGVNYKVRYLPEKWFNKREAVEIAKDKYSTLFKLKEEGISVPEFTTHSGELDRNYVWYARDDLRSSQGRGIRIIKPEDEVGYSPLYVKRVEGDREYRIHVFNGEVIAISKKEINPNAEMVNQYIKNHDKGWFFKKCDIDKVHDEAKNLAINSIRALGLDFGAVDLVYDRNERKGWVLEINTAPGMEEDGHVFEAYEKALYKLVTGSNLVEEYDFDRWDTDEILGALYEERISLEEAKNLIDDVLYNERY